jgi:hypothetical protein
MDNNINPKVLEFIGAGFRLENSKPFYGSQCIVITDQLNIYTAVFSLNKEFRINGVLVNNENVIAWKYVKQKKS